MWMAGGTKHRWITAPYISVQLFHDAPDRFGGRPARVEEFTEEGGELRRAHLFSSVLLIDQEFRA